MADKVSIYDENGELAEGVERIRTQCYFCHANCGVLAYVKDGDVIKIEGDPDYNNQGGLCCRGTSALLHVNHPARINHALKRAGEKGENKWEQIPYDQAIKEVAERLNQIKAESGAEAVASAGGTTRTDDWARRRFLNQFGTPNGFHNALLCWIPTFMAETVVAGWSPFETDLGAAKCLILWGMNPAASSLPSMHGYTDLQLAGMKIIYVDPRFSETACKADLWLPLRPGSDTALSLAMLNVIINEFLYDFDFVDKWCDGFEELREHMAPYTPEWAAPITWLDPEDIRKAARMYATTKPGCIQWGCSWDQFGPASATGSQARQLMRAITGNLEVPGGDGMPGPALNFITDEELELNELLPEEQKAKQIGSDKFKLTSWPGYTLISNNAKRTWGKTLPAEWFCEAHGPSVFKAILTGEPYQIRALICNATNPVNSYGDSKMTLAALKKVEFLVTVDYWMTPAALFSDYVFPAAGALEVRIPRTGRGRRKRKSTPTSSLRWVFPAPTGTTSSTTSACTIRRCTRTSTSRAVASGRRPARSSATPRSCASWAILACRPTCPALRTTSTIRNSPKSTRSCSPRAAASCRTTTPSTSRCRVCATCTRIRTTRSTPSSLRSLTSSTATGAGSRPSAAASRCARTSSPRSILASCSCRVAGGSPSATPTSTLTTRLAASSPTPTSSPLSTSGTATRWAAPGRTAA